MKAIIFDFDGTIGDSLKVVIEIAHDLTHKNQLVEPAEIARLRKLRLLNVAKELNIPKWRWPYLILRGRHLMGKRLNEVKPFPGICDVLHGLKADGYQLFIMSSNSVSNINSFLAHNGLSDVFISIYGGVGLLNKAPVLRKIISQNQLRADEVIYVGDEPRDIQASTAVGMPCVAVAWGYNAPELLAEHAPMVVVRTATQLHKVLEEWGSEI